MPSVITIEDKNRLEDVFIVTITEDSTTQYGYVADKDTEEIYEAHNSGKFVFAIYDKEIFVPNLINSGACRFYFMAGSTHKTIQIMSSGTVYVTTSDINMVFTVTVTEKSDGSGYEADKTFEEIYKAYLDGKIVYAKYGAKIFSPLSIGNALARFVSRGNDIGTEDFIGITKTLVGYQKGESDLYDKVWNLGDIKTTRNGNLSNESKKWVFADGREIDATEYPDTTYIPLMPTIFSPGGTTFNISHKIHCVNGFYILSTSVGIYYTDNLIDASWKIISPSDSTVVYNGFKYINGLYVLIGTKGSSRDRA